MKTLIIVGLMLIALTGVAQTAAHNYGYGAIELGSRGARGILFSFVAENEGPVPDLIFSQTINTSLVSSMDNGWFSPGGITNASDTVHKLVETLRKEALAHALEVRTFYILGSSGVAKGTIDRPSREN